MNSRMLYSHAKSFRDAIVRAKEQGFFDSDINLKSFPWCSCRDASYLLAEYLGERGIDTIIVFTDDREYGTHAWLVVKDSRIVHPKKNHFEFPDYIKSTMELYNGSSIIDNENYTANCVKNGIIIDITGSQYDRKYNQVYVGKMDDFHLGFDFRSAEDYVGLPNRRLENLYDIIIRQLE